jgi:hypothetical protein
MLRKLALPAALVVAVLTLPAVVRGDVVVGPGGGTPGTARPSTSRSSGTTRSSGGE